MTDPVAARVNHQLEALVRFVRPDPDFQRREGRRVEPIPTSLYGQRIERVKEHAAAAESGRKTVKPYKPNITKEARLGLAVPETLDTRAGPGSAQPRTTR